MTKEKIGKVKGTRSPSEFMRIRRPELFSDTKNVEECILEKSFLVYNVL